MYKCLLFSFAYLLVSSCKMLPASDKQFETIDPHQIYQLRLHPTAGSKYYYDILNETSIKLDAGNNKMNNLNRTTIGVTYAIDTIGSSAFFMTMRYDKIKVYSKTAEVENDMDADNAAFTTNPAEKMLGILKTANIIAEVSTAGAVKSVTGYKELTAKLMDNLGTTDLYTRSQVQKQWDQFVEKGFVKNNLDQLFKIFPDSAVHIGDKWKLDLQQSQELGLIAKTSFQLKEIADGVAKIVATGDIRSENKSTNLMGQVVTANLTGTQEGEYKISISTGMLISSRVNATVEGRIQMMGRDIPVQVSSSIVMNGRSIN